MRFQTLGQNRISGTPPPIAFCKLSASDMTQIFWAFMRSELGVALPQSTDDRQSRRTSWYHGGSIAGVSAVTKKRCRRPTGTLLVSH